MFYILLLTLTSMIIYNKVKIINYAQLETGSAAS